MWHNVIAQGIQVAGLLIGGWLVRVLSRPKAHEAAQHLAVIAHDVVNLLVATHPGQSWDDYLADAVREITDAAGLSVTDPAAIARAAAAALTVHGVTPVLPMNLASQGAAQP